jgi:hypothetical protein
VYAVNYDLRTKADPDYKGLKKELQNSFRWWHHLKSTWLIVTKGTPTQLWNRIRRHVHTKDFVLVIEVRDNCQGWLPTRVWAERGTRPTAPQPVGYAHRHGLTAVGPATGPAEGLICQRRNAGAVQRFWDQLSAAIPAGVHVALAGDGAGWHTAGSLRVPANRAPRALPRYAPALNPVERRWRYRREHHGSNRGDRDRAALGGAAVAGWRAGCLDPETIKTVYRCEYAQPGC